MIKTLNRSHTKSRERRLPSLAIIQLEAFVRARKSVGICGTSSGGFSESSSSELWANIYCKRRNLSAYMWLPSGKPQNLTKKTQSFRLYRKGNKNKGGGGSLPVLRETGNTVMFSQVSVGPDSSAAIRRAVGVRRLSRDPRHAEWLTCHDIAGWYFVSHKYRCAEKLPRCLGV